MRRVFRPVLLLHPDPRLRARVREACGEEYRVAELDGWPELEEAVREAPPGATVVVDPYRGEARGAGKGALAPELREMLAAYPSTPFVAAMAIRPERHEDLRRLGRWGVVQVVAIGHDDTVAAIGMRLRSARGRPMRALLEQVLPPETSGRARAIIEAAANVVTAGEHGRDLASTLHVSRRTLLRWCERAGLPPPRRLLAWMRILLACELLDDPGRSVLSVARTAGYAADSGLRRITQKFLQASPTELRDAGAFPRAAAAFVQVLHDTRGKMRMATREG
ncbi:MAG TPA: helix-turn-helix domain-containing protein [Longimicrobium sp.]|nr:helix-turn-helix domain-containing protein [Longimicrobium sp.]